MLARAFFSTLFSISAFADVSADCVQYLTRVERESHGHAQVYVRLIEYYMRNAQGSLTSADTIIEEVLRSGSPMNPFADCKDQLAIQLSKSTAKFAKKMTADDWKIVKSDLSRFHEKSAQEDSDRSVKNSESAEVMNPYAAEIFKTGAEIYSTPAIHNYKGRALVALVSRDQNLYLLELKDGQLKKLSEFKVDGSISVTPAWLELNGQLYIAFGNSVQKMHIIEVVNDELIERVHHRTGSPVYAPAAWQVIDDRAYLAYGTFDNHINLYEFNGKTFRRRSRVQTMGPSEFAPAWRTIGGRHFLAHNFVGIVALYELVNGELVRNASFRSDSIVTGSAWHRIGEREFFAIGTLTGQVQVFEAVGGQITWRATSQVQKAILNQPSWQTVNGESYLAVGSQASKLHLFKFDGEKLEAVSSAPSNGMITKSSPAWIRANDQTFVAVGTKDGWVNFYELVDGALEVRNPFFVGQAINSTPTAFVDSKGPSVLVGSDDHSMYWLRMFQSESDRGGER